MAKLADGKKAKNKKTVKPKVVAQAKNETGSRVRKLTKRRAIKEKKKQSRSQALPSAWIILKNALKHLYTHKRLFIGILLVYGVLNAVFARGISSGFQLDSLNQQLTENLGNELTGISKGTALFGLLLGSGATTDSEAGGIYQTIFVIITSLALIWALRRTYAGDSKIRIKDAFYKSTQPLIPFVLVLLLVALQMIPFLIAASLFSSVQGASLVVSGAEQVLWLLVFLLGSGISVYFVSSSLFAAYIVTLPGGRPWAALKAGKGLVRYRRWLIIRKILFFPAVTLLILAIILVPLIILLAPAAEVLFLIFSVFLLGIAHSYYYSLYRSLL